MTSTKHFPFLYFVKKEEDNLLIELKEYAQRLTQPTQSHSRCRCGGEYVRTTRDYPHTYEAEEEVKEIILKNVPCKKCKNCGELSFNLGLFVMLEKTINKEVVFRLKNRIEIPEIETVDFQEFIN